MREINARTREHAPVHYTDENLLAPLLSERMDVSLIEDHEVRDLILRERAAPVSLSIDNSLRPKIIDSCGMTCTFCHNEGTPVASSFDSKTFLPVLNYNGGRVSVFQGYNGVDFIPGRMEADDSYRQSLQAMMEAGLASEVHLTGGEPTLHPHLPDMVRAAKELGYTVKMTSNGENGLRQIEACASAGLDKINFSIFGTTPEELAEVQHQKYSNVKRAERKLNALHASIAKAIECGVQADANIVMSNYSHAERVARIIDRYGDNVSVRILNDLGAGDESCLAIYRLLADLHAEPVEVKVGAGTSNSRVRYELPDGMSIYFKQIRRTVLPETCGSCELNNNEDCSEGYYGMRLYVDNQGQYKVGVCLQRMDLTSDIDDFLSGNLPQEIVQHRYNEYNILKEKYKGRIADDA